MAADGGSAPRRPPCRRRRITHRGAARATSNRDRVRRGFEVLAERLEPFVEPADHSGSHSGRGGLDHATPGAGRRQARQTGVVRGATPLCSRLADSAPPAVNSFVTLLQTDDRYGNLGCRESPEAARQTWMDGAPALRDPLLAPIWLALQVKVNNI